MGIALACAAALVATAEPPAETRPLEKVGILELNLIGLEPKISTAAIDTLAHAIAQSGRHEVITRNELVAMLNAEANKQLLGCTDTDCLAAIGAAAGVELTLSGSIARLDDLLVVGLQLVEVGTASVRNRVAIEYAAPLAGLPRLLELAAARLVLPDTALTPGSARLSGLPAEAAITVDGLARARQQTELNDLGVDVHRLTVAAPGYELYSAPFIVLPGETAELSVRLTPVAPPFWTRWWFWSLVGGAVVAGATTAVLATAQEPSGVRLRTTAPGVTP